MRLRLATALTAALLAGLLPATVTAEPAVRFEDHHIGFYCEEPIDDGLAAIHIDVGFFGDFGGADVWLDPALPFEDPPTLAGGTEAVTLTPLASGYDMSVSFTVFDAEGDEVGVGAIEATLTPNGDLEVLNNGREGNRHTILSGTFQPMEASGTLTMPGLGEVAFGPCGADETIVTVIETDPHAFTVHNQGTVIDCFWATDDSVAALFAINDSFGSFVDAFLDTADGELIAAGPSELTLTAESLSATVELFDPLTGDPGSATAEATFSPVGDPVSSVILSASARDKVLEQRLSPSGELTFSTGDVFVIDDTACSANTFDSHFLDSGPAGPKAGGRPPANDTPEGAIPLTIGSHLNVQTAGAALEPEVPAGATCDEPETDGMGKTVWYTFEGTGGEATLDTAGSNFDTVIAVYVEEGGELVEIACVDDVFFDPIGVTFQAAITGPTEEGVTYWIQVGGFDARVFEGDVEFGRLRISVS